jgi:hypothetical protein
MPTNIVEAVNPNQMDKVAPEGDGSFKFRGRKQQASVSGDGDHFLTGTNKAGRNRPWQTHTERLLSVRHQNLPCTKAVKMPRQPNVERSHVQAQGHVITEQGLKLLHKAHGMVGVPLKAAAFSANAVRFRATSRRSSAQPVGPPIDMVDERSKSCVYVCGPFQMRPVILVDIRGNDVDVNQVALLS